MKIVELKVDLIGPEALVNGRTSQEGKSLFEEKIFINQVSPQQQWDICCEVRKLATEIFRAYRVSQVMRGEISEADAKRLGIDI